MRVSVDVCLSLCVSAPRGTGDLCRVCPRLSLKAAGIGSSAATSAVTTLNAKKAVAENRWTDDSLCRLCKTMERQKTGASFRAEQWINWADLMLIMHIVTSFKRLKEWKSKWVVFLRTAVHGTRLCRGQLFAGQFNPLTASVRSGDQVKSAIINHRRDSTWSCDPFVLIHMKAWRVRDASAFRLHDKLFLRLAELAQILKKK